ncbi:MAG: hypothetical protein HOP23_03840 [Methylococcaceae bacterium]|nr:hypothetical protein [Methylococcaceae bacterium]
MSNQQKKNRRLIIFIFGMSIIPFLIAWIFTKNSSLLSNKTNHGQLISPVISTERSDFSGFDSFSSENINELTGHWLIVNVIPTNHCNARCLDALLKTRQIRLMLNKDLPRTRRVVIVFEKVVPEISTQWWLKDALLWRLRDNENKESALQFTRMLQEENSMEEALIEKLIGSDNKAHALNSDLIRVVPNDSVRKKITQLNKGGINDGMLFLIDPLGNIMMHYEPGFDPYKVKSDLTHLLRISQIG